MIKINVNKILATGCYKSYMWVSLPHWDFSLCVPISRDLYYELKSLGVRTSQSLRKK